MNAWHTLTDASKHGNCSWSKPRCQLCQLPLLLHVLFAGLPPSGHCQTRTTRCPGNSSSNNSSSNNYKKTHKKHKEEVGKANPNAIFACRASGRKRRRHSALPLLYSFSTKRSLLPFFTLFCFGFRSPAAATAATTTTTTNVSCSGINVINYACNNN